MKDRMKKKYTMYIIDMSWASTLVLILMFSKQTEQTEKKNYYTRETAAAADSVFTVYTHESISVALVQFV